jgi:hypothetical protein
MLPHGPRPGHREAVTRPGHREAVTRPGHREAVTRPGHREAVTRPGHREAVGTRAGQLPGTHSVSPAGMAASPAVVPANTALT